MLKYDQMEIFSKLSFFGGLSFEALPYTLLTMFLSTAPRWSDPGVSRAAFEALVAGFYANSKPQGKPGGNPLPSELKSVETELVHFLHGLERDEGVLIYASENPFFLQLIPLPFSPENRLFYDCSLHLELLCNYLACNKADADHWLKRQAVNNRVKDPEFIQRLGYGAFDVLKGEWAASGDIALFTESGRTGPRFFVRYLLNILGRRFPDALAVEIWEEITRFGQERCAEGLEPLLREELTREWYRCRRVEFLKEWYFGPHCPERHYLKAGHEWEPGPRFKLLNRLSPEWEILGRAGISLGQVWRVFATYPGYCARNWKTGNYYFWAWFVTQISETDLSPGEIERAALEIESHSASSGFPGIYSKPSQAACAATLDYFRRLEMAGLGPEAIGV